MVDLPELSETAENATQEARNLLWFLPDPYQCDHCGSYCLAETEYVANQAEYLPVWVCPTEGCNSRYHRDEPWH